jgi:hypothetical protein
MLILPLGLDVAEASPTTKGVTPTAKKPTGYIRVIALEAESAPPALGVKPNVTGTPALPTTRSLLEILNATLETASPIYPEGAPSDGICTSRLVVTKTELPAVGSSPIVSPMSVTLTATLPATLPDVNVITTLESPQGDDAAETPPLKETLAGVTPEAKNLKGYMRVIVLEAESAPPALGVKPNVTGTPTLLTTRSLLAIPKATFETAPTMYPDGVLRDINGS